MVSIFPLVLTKIHYSMNNTHNISSCDITPTLMYCNFGWYRNPSFFIGQVLLTTDVWSSLWDVFYCDGGPPILVCWYTQSSVGTHGRMSRGNMYIYCLIDNTALAHNDDPPSCSTAQQYGRVNRAAANNGSIITIHLPADQSHNKIQ